MSNLTATEVYGLMEAYNAVYAPQISGEQLWEEAGYLTEEFVLESYQTVADYLVHYGVVPGYNTAELFMSEMALEDIDAILFETGILDEEYLIEAGFFQGLGAGADRFISRATNKARQVGKAVSGTAQRAGSAVAGGVKAAAGAAQRAGQTAAGTTQRVGAAAQRKVQGAVTAGQSALGAAQRKVQGAVTAGQGALKGAQQTAAGTVQRIGDAANRKITPVAQAVKGTAQRAVAAGQSALGAAQRKVQGAVSTAQRNVQGAVTAGQGALKGAQQTVNRAVQGTTSRALSTANRAVTGAKQAVAGAARRVGQEIEISRKVGAGEPLTSAKPRPIKEASRLFSSFDPYDIVKGHLLDEGYADTEDAALAIMANMSEQWKQSILEG